MQPGVNFPVTDKNLEQLVVKYVAPPAISPFGKLDEIMPAETDALFSRRDPMVPVHDDYTIKPPRTDARAAWHDEGTPRAKFRPPASTGIIR
jgi:hypothetical protein